MFYPILISITLEDNILAGQRLVKKIKDQFKIPIFVGGFAMQSEKIYKFDARVVQDTPLENIPKILKEI